jgi:phosphate transport system substrate-binding protein
VEYSELPVAFDSLSVVVSAKNSFVECLSVGELEKLWEPQAEGKVTRWDQVRPSFPAEPIALFGPDKESGTFDYFGLAILGTESQSRGDFTKSEDDAVIGRGVAADPNALGYFGYANYFAHADALKLVAVDSGKGCVLPSAATVTDGSYQPLSRPLFIYVNHAAAVRPEVSAFVHYYLTPANSKLVEKVGYVPLSPVSLLAADSRFSRGVTGSALGGRGSIVGVGFDSFKEEEQVKNALVR